MKNRSITIIDGREVSALVINEDYSLTGTHRGGVEIAGGTFVLLGTIQGSLHISAGLHAEIRGQQQGSLHADKDTTVTVTGAIQGSLHISDGATVIIEAQGRLAGSLHNDGLLILRGRFGGSRTGRGEVRLEEHGTILTPRVVDGMNIYDWK